MTKQLSFFLFTLLAIEAIPIRHGGIISGPIDLNVASSPTPIVIWHGMGDTCCYSFSMGRIKSLLESAIPGVYVHSLMIGDSIEGDEYNGFFMNVNDQIDFAAKQIAADPKLKGGFNAIGFSQGSQFLRAYVQRYNTPAVKNLISIGGQHQGVFGFPHCPGTNYKICEWVRELLDYGAYISFVQRDLVQAEYWHDPLDEDTYLSSSLFLPDINNERKVKNSTYKENLVKLDNFVMVKFLLDTMVQPIESESFEFYKSGQDTEIVPLRESALYKEDWLGLQVLDKQKKLHFLEVNGDHLKFTDDWFLKSIVAPYLNGTVTN